MTTFFSESPYPLPLLGFAKLKFILGYKFPVAGSCKSLGYRAVEPFSMWAP